MTTTFSKPVTEREKRAVRRMREGRTYYVVIDQRHSMERKGLSFEDCVENVALDYPSGRRIAVATYVRGEAARRTYLSADGREWRCVWPPQPESGGLPLVRVA